MLHDLILKNSNHRNIISVRGSIKLIHGPVFTWIKYIRNGKLFTRKKVIEDELNDMKL